MIKKSLLFLMLILLSQCQLPDPADNIAPTIFILNPNQGEVVSANINVLIEATDDDKVSKVKLYLDGALVGEKTKAPYLFQINIDTLRDGLTYNLQATAIDPSKNISTTLITFIIANTPDVIDPTVSIVNPQTGQTVEGTVKIVAIAEDERSIQKVAFFVDGDSVGEDFSYPYSYDWDTTPFADSTNHTIYAKAYDSGNNSAISSPVTVTVYPRIIVGDITPPNVLVLYPVTGSTVSGTVNIVADVTDDHEVDHVEFYIDGILKSTDTNGADNWSYSWNTAPYANGGSHSVYIKAYDTSDNVGTSTVVVVTVPAP